MRFSRWHAHGNKYLLAERDKVCGPLLPEVVRDLCRDADGIVEVVATAGNEATVIVWNADGSTAEMSGNATRIAARWLAAKTGASVVEVHVGARTVSARIAENGVVEQDMGEVEVSAPEEIEGIQLTPVSVGNPHAVVIGDPGEIERIGPLLESHARFPERTNVQIVHVDGPGEVTARVWERGVGETTSSGTSAVAVAATTHPSGGEVVVHFPGGDLVVRLEGRRAYLTGPAERID